MRAVGCIISSLRSIDYLSMSNFNLEAYFNRINYQGSKLVQLETLNGITNAHVKSIPFENLDVLLKKPINLSDESIFEKLVIQRRGGYCFEQNSLLMRALEHLGFKVSPLSARVRLQRPREEIPPRTHLFLRVDLNTETWLTDVGIGAASLTSAIKLNTQSEQATPHEPRRILKEDQRWFHQIKYGNNWSDVCEFTMEEMPLIDRELSNWFTSTHPNSHFKNRLMVAKSLDSGCRITLLNNYLTHRDQNGASVQKQINNNIELIDILSKEFGIHLPSNTAFKGNFLPW